LIVLDGGRLEALTDVTQAGDGGELAAAYATEETSSGQVSG
jgi:hypothetical protein